MSQFLVFDEDSGEWELVDSKQEAIQFVKENYKDHDFGTTVYVCEVLSTCEVKTRKPKLTWKHVTKE